MAALKRELAKTKADAARDRKEHHTRAVTASTAALAQQGEQRAIITRLEAQIMDGQNATAEALAVHTSPMDTSEVTPSVAQATDR